MRSCAVVRRSPQRSRRAARRARGAAGAGQRLPDRGRRRQHDRADRSRGRRRRRHEDGRGRGRAARGHREAQLEADPPHHRDERRSGSHGRQRASIERRHVRAAARHVRSARHGHERFDHRARQRARAHERPERQRAPRRPAAWPSDTYFTERVGAVRERRGRAADSRSRGAHRRRHDGVLPPLRRDQHRATSSRRRAIRGSTRGKAAA